MICKMIVCGHPWESSKSAPVHRLSTNIMHVFLRFIMRTIQGRRNAPLRILHLQPNKSVSIEARPGLMLACLQGELWITQEGELPDFIVAQGYRYCSQGSGKIVVNSLANHSTAMIYHETWNRHGISTTPCIEMDASQLQRLAQYARWLRNNELRRLIQCFIDSRNTRNAAAQFQKEIDHAQTCL